jgi:hypothetical protein
MATEENSLNSFGIVIAYVLPGYVARFGFPLFSQSPTWGMPCVDANSNLTSFLSGTVEALAVGFTVSAVRWLVIDTLHHKTGLRRPVRDFAELKENVAAYEFLGLIHYRYYKATANMVVALIWAYATREYVLGWYGLRTLPLIVLFFLASRDTLRKYYERTGSLLGPESRIIEL